jgi:hypothetical protein
MVFDSVVRVLEPFCLAGACPAFVYEVPSLLT